MYIHSGSYGKASKHLDASGMVGLFMIYLFLILQIYHNII